MKGGFKRKGLGGGKSGKKSAKRSTGFLSPFIFGYFRTLNMVLERYFKKKRFMVAARPRSASRKRRMWQR